MNQVKKVNGILWDDGVVCNSKWGGVRLRDVLLDADIDFENMNHVQFASHVTLCEDDTYYGASIPLQKAMDEEGDVLIAWEVRIRRSTLTVAQANDTCIADERGIHVS